MSATNWRTHLAARRLLTLVLLPCLMSSAANISRPKITCQAGQFEIGQAASVTCIFHKNIKESKTGFNVTARFFDTPDVQRSVPVVTCKYIQDGTLYCLLGDGFVPRDMAPTDHLTIDIPQFAHNQAGEYKCEATDDATPTERCFLLPKYIDGESRESSDHAWNIVLIIALATLCLLLVFQWLVIIRQRKGLQDNDINRRFKIRRKYQQQTVSSRVDSRQHTNNKPRAKLLIFRSPSQTQADYAAELEENMLQKRASSDSEENDNGYQFKFRSGSQTLADYEASSTSVDSQGNTTNSPTDNEEPSLNRSKSQIQTDYKAESPNTTTNNHSDNKEPAQYTGLTRSRLAVAAAKRVRDPEDPKDHKVPKQQFNWVLGMARRPYLRNPTEGIITRQRSYENDIFPMKELEETSLKEGRKSGRKGERKNEP